MNRDEAIDEMNSAGHDYDSSFHEGLPGYFGWSIDGHDVLLVAGEIHTVSEEDGIHEIEVEPFSYAWKLVPIDGD